MTPHRQTIFEDKCGDCFATCIASILDLPLSEVPNFRKLQTDGGLCMVGQADTWLRENHGKRLIGFELFDQAEGPNKGHVLTTQCVMNRLAYRNRDDLVILSGESPRRKADGSVKYHCVVGRAEMWGFKLVHDPHPDDTGIIGQPYSARWIVPL